MTTRFTFAGDEHLFAEIDEAMSFRPFFKSLAMMRAISARRFPGVSEVCGGNGSYQIRFDPDRIAPDDMLREIERLDRAADAAPPVFDTRIVEVPVYYNDPWTRETLMRFRERHQDPNATDLEYAARINGYTTVEEVIHAHHASPWFVTMVGFVTGCPWFYQMVERKRQIEVPKYVRPRTDTPRHTIGHGGCFTAIYAVRGAGGYQMFGITPQPLYDPGGGPSYLREKMVLFDPGDIIKFRPVERAEYDAISAAVAADQWTPKMRPLSFDLREFERDMDGYNARIVEVLNHA
jgi:allophanate hydrolase subunit 1